MSGFLLVLALAAMPAAANVVGGLAAELVEVSERSLSLALHLAAGVVLGVVGLELMPEALDTSAPWMPILAFAAGGALFVALGRALGVLQGRTSLAAQGSGPLAIYGAVSIDLFSDGILIGTATVVDPALGLLLALGQVPADLPEGFAALASLRRAGLARSRRLALSASFTAPVLVGAALGYLALRGAPDVVTLSVLALTGGVLTSVVLEEMITEAHHGDTSHLGPLFLTSGFALFAAVSVLVG